MNALQLTTFSMLIFFGFNSSSKADLTLPPMKPLSQYLATNDIRNDPEVFGYLMARCASYYGIIAGLLDGSNNPNYTNTKKDFEKAQTNFINGWLAFSKKVQPNLSEADRTKQLSKIGDSIIRAYAERVNATRARTGNMFDDSLVKDDGETCKIVHNNIFLKQ